MSFKTGLLSGALVVAMAAIVGGVGTASAAKKLTYEQAWAHCKALMDKEKTPGTTTMGNERMVRGGACMQHYGYKL
jgi:hypothetical protein